MIVIEIFIRRFLEWFKGKREIVWSRVIVIGLGENRKKG